MNLRSVAQSQPSSSITRAVPSAIPHLSSSIPVPQRDISAPDSDRDAEQVRKQTIAERMAKLGGIKFGAVPIPASAARPQPPVSQEEHEEGVAESEEVETPTNALSDEEEERARKERIASKMAQMGGMRIGMMPMGTGGFSAQASHIIRAGSDNIKPALPPAVPVARTVPPSRKPTLPLPPPPGADTDSQ